MVYPHITSNMKEPLYKLSDNGMHKSCFNLYAEKNKALFFMQLHDAAISAYYKHGHAKDVITTVLLTSDAAEPLYKYNFAVLEKHVLISSGEDKILLAALLRFKDEGKWQCMPGCDLCYIDDLIKRISSL